MSASILQNRTGEVKNMDHHPYITLNDNTEITYSDIKTNTDGKEYITVYFETPTHDGFSSMQVDYPSGTAEKIIGYTEQQVSELMKHYSKVGHLVFEFAKENKNGIEK